VFVVFFKRALTHPHFFVFIIALTKQLVYLHRPGHHLLPRPYSIDRPVRSPKFGKTNFPGNLRPRRLGALSSRRFSCRKAFSFVSQGISCCWRWVWAQVGERTLWMFTVVQHCF
jgi:hypothetical protein